MAFFSNISSKDQDTYDLVMRYQQQQKNIRLAQGELYFTLKGLYQLLYQEGDESYPQFKKILYSSDLNTQLGRFGYCVDIWQSTGKVDTSWYCLKPLLRSE